MASTQDRMEIVYMGTMPNLCCCEAALRKMPNGEWLTIFMTGGPTEPRRGNHIVSTRSTDQGKTWSKPEVLFQEPSQAVVASELMVVGERVTIFLGVHNGIFDYWRSFYSFSDDSGYTWSSLFSVPHLPQKTFVRNAIRRRNGELVLPFQHYPDLPDNDGQFSKKFLPQNGVLISSDDGKNFEVFGNIRLGFRSMAELNVVELSDDSLVMLIRADGWEWPPKGKGFLYRSDSSDGGRTWSDPYPTDIPNPASKFRLHKLSDGRIILIHNPNPSGRHPLSLWISKDDMKTWSYKRDLVTFPGRLQYPDGFVDEKEGYVHFVFDYNRHDVIYMGARLP